MIILAGILLLRDDKLFYLASFKITFLLSLDYAKLCLFITGFRARQCRLESPGVILSACFVPRYYTREYLIETLRYQLYQLWSAARIS